MPKHYDPKVKEAILKAAADARKGNGTWADAHEMAKKAGYKGSQGGLVQMFNKPKAGKKSKQTRGERGNGNGSAPKDIQTAIEVHIQKRVNAKLAEVISEVESFFVGNG